MTIAPALLERLEEIEAGPYRYTVRRIADLLATLPATQEGAARAAVLTNMLGVVARGDAADFQRTASLIHRYGHRLVADLQSEFEDLLSIGPNQPFATATIVKLSSPHTEHLLCRAGLPPEEAHLVATECARAAFWLLVAGIDPTRRVPVPSSSAGLRATLEHHGVRTWRGILANVAANPWGPDTTRLMELAEEAELALPARAIAECVRLYRKQHEDDDRLMVAREIRRLVAISGCSQRQFAKHVGTSAPRLSTYVNGVVTPSSTMLLRMTRCAHDLATLSGSGPRPAPKPSWVSIEASA